MTWTYSIKLSHPQTSRFPWKCSNLRDRKKSGPRQTADKSTFYGALADYNVFVRNIVLPIVIEANADGYFVSCPSLQGCYSQGDSYEEAVENIRDAIRLHIQDRLADGEEIPQTSIRLSTVEIAV
jgi:predicted RNase H-like HicB family nuclease